MPIGKNAIKRVENNGYSKVASKAPDMENSSVIANLDPQVEEKIISPVAKKTATRKPAAKKPTEVAAEIAPAAAPAKTAQKRKCAKKSKDGFIRIEVGEAMPYYLL